MGRPKGSKNKKTLLKEQQQLTSDQLTADNDVPKDSLEESNNALLDRLASLPTQTGKSNKVLLEEQELLASQRHARDQLGKVE